MLGRNVFGSLWLGSRLASLRSSLPARSKRTPWIHSASLFTASIGVASCPKRRASQSNPESGEDAYFVHNPSTLSKDKRPRKKENNDTADGNGGKGGSATESDRHVWAGVFDGVGGWADRGVDPGVFAHGLARHCLAVASSSLSSSDRDDGKSSMTASPGSVLQEGYDRVLRDAAIAMGSSTACVARIDLETGEMEVANLGDCGLLIFDTSLPAHESLVHASTPQTYFFNAPYQLAKIPRALHSPDALENLPSDADVTTHRLTTNHVVVLATDGFLDNVFSRDAAKIIATAAQNGDLVVGGGSSAAGTKQEMCRLVASRLRDAAKKAGRSREKSPFSEEARAHGLRHDGGKEDDVCVVVMALDALEPIKAKL